MEYSGVMLDAQKVHEAERRYNLRNPSISKIKLSFGELLKRFLNDEVTYDSIAKECGVSGEAVRLIHKNYFSDFLPASSERQKRRAAKRWQKIESQPASDLIRDVSWLASRHGLRIQQVRCGSKQVIKTHLLINGMLCQIRHTTASNVLSGNTEYARIQIGQDVKAYRFLIVLVQIPEYAERCYVLPVHDLWVLLGGVKRKNLCLFNLERVRQMSNAPDFERYENAWHLLQEGGAERDTAPEPKRIGGRLITPTQVRVLELFRDVGSLGLWGSQVAKQLLLSQGHAKYTLQTLEKEGYLLSLPSRLIQYKSGAVLAKPCCITPLGIAKLQERKEVDKFLQHSISQG